MKLTKKINNYIKNITTTCINAVIKVTNKNHYTSLKEFIRKELFDEIQQQYTKTVSIVDPLKTLKKVDFAITNNRQGAYMRFGDGDAYLANGLNDKFQTASVALSEEMKEAFLLKGEFIYKSLSIHSKLYGYEKEMYVGNHLVSDQLANKLLKLTFPFFIGHTIFSPISLHFAATYHPTVANAFLKKMKTKCILFIGNESIPNEKITLLFGNVQHIKTPKENAFKEMDTIEAEAIKALKNVNEFGVVVVAMGCSGRPMMKRLFNRNFNIFLFDFGSLLDGICGYDSRTWLKKESIQYDILLKDL